VKSVLPWYKEDKSTTTKENRRQMYFRCSYAQEVPRKWIWQ
jgi:hypothetical protein